MNCPTCQSEIAAGARFCSACGGAIAGEDSETVVATPRSGPDSGGERLVPGIVLADRYRIVGRLGRGGMGEVYRADDLKLGQPVALKFLPEGLESDPRRLELLLEEVRVARGVSHPNLCRVYDVGEAGGHHFLCMEYVDGEDLATLLRRIGRLAGDKAAQIARQLCAGLAALHEQGVIHRDLKPANVMIDGRGRARITDFGLARPTEALAGQASRDGTPAYMAPEQLAGREATARSDIYALGLVLYELFTGRRPFADARSFEEALDERASGPPTSPSSHVAELDPAVERAIQRCLEPDPERRHVSALGVAAALPGGDPLAAALAAGETPSPELVAAAPAEGAIAPVLAWGAALVCLLGVVGGLWLHHRVVLAPDGRPPLVLADRARETLRALGVGAPVRTGENAGAGATGDEAWGYMRSEAARALFRDRPELMPAMMRGDAPPLYTFWYRSSPSTLMPEDWIRVGPDDPPLEPGATRLLLRTDGTLQALDRPLAPPMHGAAGVSRAAGAAGADWEMALRLAGFEGTAGLEPAAPAVPPVFADERVAWTGTYPSGLELRVDGAALGGEVVWFQVTSPDYGGMLRSESLPAVFFVLLVSLFAGVVAIGLALARRNLRSGRGDRRGALRVGLLVGGSNLVAEWLLADHGLARGEFLLLWRGVADSLLFTLLTALFYLGLEPMLRRRWPHRIVGWMRALDGRFRDPRVGGELLAGAVGAMLFSYLPVAGFALVRALGGTERFLPVQSVEPAALGARGVVAALPVVLSVGIPMALGFAVLAFALVRLVRSVPLGGALFTAIMLFGLTVRNELWSEPGLFLVFAISASLVPIVLLRFGLLALATHLVLGHLAILFPVTQFSGAWYSGTQPVRMAALVLVACYGAWVCARRDRRAGPAEGRTPWQAATPTS